jgi:DNA-binding NarL/FixJ family response regulator
MEKIKLMLTEDQELIRTSLEIVLNMEEDIEVIGLAENGEKAVKLAGELHPDVIFMDIHMPVMNGIEATKLIKEKHPDIKIIILTTFQEMDYVIEALQAGAEGYLLKAIDTKDLAAGVRMVAKGGSLISQDLAKQLFSQHIKKIETKEANPTDTYHLSQREVEVLECLTKGLSNQAISDKLFLSIGTVKNYISNIYAKLGVANRTEAIQKIQKN